jgi:hypothetical protein
MSFIGHLECIQVGNEVVGSLFHYRVTSMLVASAYAHHSSHTFRLVAFILKHIFGVGHGP